MTFQNALDFVLQQEGGYVDEKDDKGGATKFGITIGTLSAYRGQTCTKNDVSNLTIEEASEIYHQDYWQPLMADQLPDAVALVCFDSAVNSGVIKSSKWLQKAVGCLEDGHIGPKTLSAVKQRMTIDVVNDIISYRLKFLKSLPDYIHFGNGWNNRIKKLRVKANALISNN